MPNPIYKEMMETPRADKADKFKCTAINKSSIVRYNRLIRALEAWDYHCVICNRFIDNLGCASIEHLTPQAMGGNDEHINLAPSHWICNQKRGQRSLIVAAKIMERFIRSEGIKILLTADYTYADKYVAKGVEKPVKYKRSRKNINRDYYGDESLPCEGA